jgi:hypothetical protein
MGADTDHVGRILGQHLLVGGEGFQARKIPFQGVPNLRLQIGSCAQIELRRAPQRIQTQTTPHSTADH